VVVPQGRGGGVSWLSVLQAVLQAVLRGVCSCRHACSSCAGLWAIRQQQRHSHLWAAAGDGVGRPARLRAAGCPAHLMAAVRGVSLHVPRMP
jgi:hypothetical protein